MRLDELVALRPEPAAGLMVTLTRRCPLSCAHCSTSSGPAAGERPSPQALERFIASFTEEDRPDVLLLTGGEPLLLPDLVAGLAARARAAGTRVALLSGMFFARDGRVPESILTAVRRLDHFSASLDAFHEREVARADVFAALARIRDAGVPVSLHLTGDGPADPYLSEATAEVRARFGDTVPMLVNVTRAVGRAARWAVPAATVPGPADAVTVPQPPPRPCAMAAWPVIAFDGVVVACCNEHVVDRRPVPSHLLLGHIDRDDWATVRGRCAADPVLRMLRTAGPQRLAPTTHRPAPADDCAACRGLAAAPAALAAARATGSTTGAAAVEQAILRLRHAAGPAALLRQYACAPYASLVGPAGGDGSGENR